MSKISSTFSYIRSIGLKATVSYITQRYIIRPQLIILSLPAIPHKIYLRRESKDVNVFHQIFVKQDLAFLKGENFLNCIDCGANIGLASIYMKKLFPSAKIFSIEPEPSNIEILKMNTCRYAGITVIGKALSIDDTGLFLLDIGMGADSFRTVEKTSSNALNKVESISVNGVLREFNIDQLDFFKMDIEGAEDVCINQQAISWLEKVKIFAVEIHEQMVPGCTKKIKDLLENDFSFSQRGEYSIFKKSF